MSIACNRRAPGLVLLTVLVAILSMILSFRINECAEQYPWRDAEFGIAGWRIRLCTLGLHSRVVQLGLSGLLGSELRIMGLHSYEISWFFAIQAHPVLAG